jgi:hypothetical protein
MSDTGKSKPKPALKKDDKGARIKAAQAKRAERMAALQKLKDGKYKYHRFVDREDKQGRPVKTLQVHMKLNPERAKAQPGYYCPAGPGMRSVPADGRWYDLTDYLRKRLISGCVVECPPPKKAAKE